MVLQIKPRIQQQSSCPHCKTDLSSVDTLWQGKRICIKYRCPGCNAEIIEELRVGHAVHHCYQVDISKDIFFGDEDKFAIKCVAEPLLSSLKAPRAKKVHLSKEVFKLYDRVIILNCIDHLYGHCLLKLLNTQQHLEKHSAYGLIVIIPKFLRWMVPAGVAEIWTVDISLKDGDAYYPHFDQIINQELQRFHEVHVSRAYSHPSQFDISRFTKIGKHDFDIKDYRVSFVWREDRVWINFQLYRALSKLGLTKLGLVLQNWKVRCLFFQMRTRLPTARFTVAGLGRQTSFPEWIEDFRVECFDETTEQETCKVYADSRLVVGIHGSNMLLPSGHSGMTIDLMPAGQNERWGNLAQDILYHECDPRMATFRYRYLSVQTSVSELARAASWMILKFNEFKETMLSDHEVSSLTEGTKVHAGEIENTTFILSE
jgi:hypothetical protein